MRQRVVKFITMLMHLIYFNIRNFISLISIYLDLSCFLNYSVINYLMNQDHKTYQRYGNFIINRNESLGAGSYGHVWKGYLIGPNQSLEPVAIKEFYNDKSRNNQIQTLQVLSHPNIVKYIDYKISGSSGFMVMELCEGGTLDDLLQSMDTPSNERLIQLYGQIVRGIKFMYEKKILHRDIKPSNLLVKRNMIKIADFGTSKMGMSSQLKTLVGTTLFFSPELFSVAEGIEAGYDEKSDIWALGLILYFMFNYQKQVIKPGDRMKASLPWQGENSSLFKNIMTKPVTFKNPNIPPQIQDIIKKMLNINLPERMSFKEFFQIELFKLPEIQDTSENTEAEQKAADEIHRETIGWELQELLELKDQQKTSEEEVEECRQFYELLVDQLAQVYDLKDYQLMFELESQYFKLTRKPEERTRIIQKYYERKSQFQSYQPQEDAQDKLENKSGLIIGCQSSLQSVVPMPSAKLIAEARHFIKDSLPQLLSPQNQNSQYFSQNKDLLFLVYDLFTLVTFEKSWQIKRKTKALMGDYKRIRNTVGPLKLVGRLRQAAQSINI